MNICDVHSLIVLAGVGRDGQNPTGALEGCRGPPQTNHSGFVAAMVSDIWRDWSNLHSHPPTLAPSFARVDRLPTSVAPTQGWTPLLVRGSKSTLST